MKLFLKIFLFLLLVAHSSECFARQVLADVMPRKIDIDHNFKGIKVLVYGVQNDVGNVVIVVRGPKVNQILREKGKVLGVWTNITNLKVKDFYNYYALAATNGLDAINNTSLLKNLEVGLDNINFEPVKSRDIIGTENKDELKNAAIRLMQSKGLYSKDDYDILYWGETLFRTFIDFPKNISKGVYNIDVYLFNDGQLQSFQSLPIIVDKVGFEEFVYNSAHENSLLYGIVSVLIAIFLGLGVGLLFGKR